MLMQRRFLARLRKRTFRVAQHDLRTRQRLQQLAARALVARRRDRQRRRQTPHPRRGVVRAQCGQPLHPQGGSGGRK